jgi:di/tricarboxylate transporter
MAMNGVNQVQGQNNRRIISRESQKEPEELRLDDRLGVIERDADADGQDHRQHHQRLQAPLADLALAEGDRLLLRCNRDDLLRLQQERTVTLAPAKLDDGEVVAVDPASQLTVEVLLPSGSTLPGETLRDLRFRQRYNATVLALRRGNAVLRERLGRVVLRDGDVLLLQAPRDAIRGLQASNDLVVLEQLEKDLAYAGRKGIALVIAVLVILLPSFKLLPLVASVLLGTVAMVVSGCLRPGDLQRSIRLDVILLLGSLASFSVALEKTGLATAIAKAMLLLVQGWPVFWALVAVFLFTTLLTEVMSNAATVALLIPIAAQLAIGLGQEPMAFIFTVLFGASQSFLSPVGYQTNLMVFAPGRYRFLDVARYGVPLTLTMTLLVPWLVCRQFGI